MNSLIIKGYILADQLGAVLISEPNTRGVPIVIDAGPWRTLSYTARRVDEAGGSPTPVVQVYGGVNADSPQSLATAETFTGTAAHKRGVDITSEAILIPKVTTAAATAGTILELTLYLNDAQ